MRKIYRCLIVLSLTALVATGGNLWAGNNPQPVKRLGIGVSAGYAAFSDEQFKGAPALGLNLTYNFSKNLRFEIRGSFISSDIENSSVGFSEGTLKITPVQVSIQYQFNVNKKLVPYLGGGAGYYLNDLSLAGQSDWQALGFNITEDADSVFGFHFGAGLDYFFKPNLAFNLDARYCIVSLDGTYSITDDISGLGHSGEMSADLNPFMFSAGIRVLF